MNFARDVVEAADPQRLALVERARDGARREWSFGEVARAARARWPRTSTSTASARGDVVLTLVGNRPEWVAAMVACFRQGYVVLPCTEQLRPKDLRLRLEVARPALVVSDERNEQAAARGGLERADDLGARAWRLARAHAAAPRRARPRGPVPDHLHERHRRRAEGRRARPALPRRPAACRPSTGSTPAPASSCGAPPPAAGASRRATSSSRPWLRGAAALLHDERFDPDERLAILDEEPVAVLCMAPTEYRIIAKRAQPRPTPTPARPGRRRRGAQPRGPARLARGHRPVGPRRLRPDRDRADHRHADRPRGGARLDGPPAAGHRRLGRGRRARRSTRPRCRPSSAATSATTAPSGPWRTGDRVTQDDEGFLFFEGRDGRRHHLRRLPDRPLRGRVGAGRAPRGGRGRRRLRPRRRARRRRARRRRAARRPRARPTRSRASCRTTSRPRPRPTSTRASSTSPASCPRRRAARSARAALRRVARPIAGLVLRAVDDDVGPADPARALGEQEGRDVGDLLRRAQAPQRELALAPTRRRPPGRASRRCAQLPPSKRIEPGLSALTRMPSGPSSRASVWARWISAAFAAAYCARGWGFMPEIDAISTAAPPPRARRCGRAARMSTAGWTTLRASVCSQSAAVVSSRAGPPAAPPALATTRSRPRSSRAHSSTAAVSAASSVTSAATPCAPTPSARSSPAARCDLLGVARAQPDGAALVGQAQDDRPADPARRARDEGDLAGEPESITSGRRRRRRGRSGRRGRHRRRRPRAALRPGLVGQAHDLRRGVVALVGLEDAVARVGAVHDGEAAAQARDVDPVVGIGRRIDVGPARPRSPA